MGVDLKKDSFSNLISSGQAVLVDFSAEWCGPCKMLAPILKQLSAKVEGKVKIIKIDVDKNPGLSDQYKIQGVPTLILFQEWKILWRQSGLVPLSTLEKTIQNFIK